MTLIDDVKRARVAAVPLVAIQTPDIAACTTLIAKGIKNGPIVAWDCVRGVYAVNDGGENVAGENARELVDPVDFLVWASSELPAKAIVFMANGCEFTERNPQVTQAIWNLRDQFKLDRRTLIIVQGTIDLPAQLKDDVVVFDEPLPDTEQLVEIVTKLDEAASVCATCGGTGVNVGLECKKCKGAGRSKRPTLDKDTRTRAVEAVRGLPAFSAEQAAAMALRKDGWDVPHLWRTKMALIEQTRGLSVYRGGENFEDLGGLASVKEYASNLFGGRRPPEVVVWLDEIEKSGLGHTGDSSGVNAEQLGECLSYMEDHGVYGLMLLGVAGSGKSAFAKALGAEFNRLVIRINMGAMKHELVGRSGSYLRTALKVVSAVGSDNALWVATSNSVSGLDTALRSRFTDTFFFDLPDKKERSAIWDVWMGKYEGVKGSVADGMDDGWVGRNIQRCVDKAWRFDRSLQEVAPLVIPQGIIEAEAITALRAEANGKYLSASKPGVYKTPKRGRGRQVNFG